MTVLMLSVSMAGRRGAAVAVGGNACLTVSTATR